MNTNQSAQVSILKRIWSRLLQHLNSSDNNGLIDPSSSGHSLKVRRDLNTASGFFKIRSLCRPFVIRSCITILMPKLDNPHKYWFRFQFPSITLFDIHVIIFKVNSFSLLRRVFLILDGWTSILLFTCRVAIDVFVCIQI